MLVMWKWARASAALPLILAALLWPSAARPQNAPEQSARFEGTWRMSHSRSEAERILTRAVDRATNGFNYFIRGIVRDRLRAGTHINQRIALDFEGDRLTVRFDRDSYTTRIGRTERERNEDGTPMRVTQRFRPSGQLEQVFETDEGTRWYVYTPVGADRMRIESTTGSPRMPDPMYFSLDYRRGG
jgi:hypothetical protein